MNSIAQAVQAQAEAAANLLGQARVHALHLPPLPADGSRRGEFAALELRAGGAVQGLGQAYVLLDDTLQRLRESGLARQLAGTPVRALLPALAGPAGLQRTLAWAAAQALADALARRAGWAPPPAGDSLAGLQAQPQDHIGMVGLFGPLIERLRASGARITVVELRAALAGPQPGYELTLQPQALQQCNKVLATGTTLLNDTLDSMLQHMRRAEHVALVGPSVGLWPEPLFERGVSLLGGTWVEQPQAFVDALLSGSERGGSARKFSLHARDWPGWSALLAAAG